MFHIHFILHSTCQIQPMKVINYRGGRFIGLLIRLICGCQRETGYVLSFQDTKYTSKSCFLCYVCFVRKCSFSLWKFPKLSPPQEGQDKPSCTILLPPVSLAMSWKAVSSLFPPIQANLAITEMHQPWSPDPPHLPSASDCSSSLCSKCTAQALAIKHSLCN